MGKVIFCEQSMEKISGRPLDAPIGRRLLRLFLTSRCVLSAQVALWAQLPGVRNDPCVTGGHPPGFFRGVLLSSIVASAPTFGWMDALAVRGSAHATSQRHAVVCGRRADPRLSAKTVSSLTGRGLLSPRGGRCNKTFGSHAGVVSLNDCPRAFR